VKRNPPIVIALDGPAGAGKSTVGLAVARALGFTFVETGKLYRAVALQALRLGVPLGDAAALAAMCAVTDLVYELRAAGPAVILDGEDVTASLAAPPVTEAASAVSANADVRAALLPLQRRLARPRGVVMEGRDIGTVVFPDAAFKFYLDASLGARAERRARDLAALGEETTPSKVAMDLEARDRRDAGRAVAPLRRADDAIYVDTTDMTFEQVVEFIVNVVRTRREPAGGGDRAP